MNYPLLISAVAVVFIVLFILWYISHNKGEEEEKETPSRVAGAPKQQDDNNVDFGMWMAHLTSKTKNMTNPFGEKTLQQITLPGTHDSGAYLLSADLAPGTTLGVPSVDKLVQAAEKAGLKGLIKSLEFPWANAQDLRIYQQARQGIRFFDIRIVYDDKQKTWRCWHTLMGLPIKSLLSDLKQFLEEFRGEVVVIEFSHLPSSILKEQAIEFATLVSNTLNGFLLPPSTTFPTLNTMVKTGKRAIVVVGNGYDELNATYGLWSDSFTLYNNSAGTTNIKTMVDFNKNEANKFKSRRENNQLFKMSWTLTPDTSSILQGDLLPCTAHNLRQLADTAAPFLPSFIASQGNQIICNTIVIDHFEKSELVKLLYKVNAESI